MGHIIMWTPEVVRNLGPDGVARLVCAGLLTFGRREVFGNLVGAGVLRPELQAVDSEIIINLSTGTATIPAGATVGAVVDEVVGSGVLLTQDELNKCTVAVALELAKRGYETRGLQLPTDVPIPGIKFFDSLLDVHLPKVCLPEVQDFPVPVVGWVCLSLACLGVVGAVVVGAVRQRGQRREIPAQNAAASQPSSSRAESSSPPRRAQAEVVDASCTTLTGVVRERPANKPISPAASRPALRPGVDGGQKRVAEAKPARERISGSVTHPALRIRVSRESEPVERKQLPPPSRKK